MLIPRVVARVAAAVVSLLATSTVFALPFTDLVVFGDSLSDPGNAYAITIANDPAKPYPPPPYVDGHFSNGITAAEYVSLRSGLPTLNFAQGGATTGSLNIDDGRCIPTRDCLSPGNYQLQPGLLSGLEQQVAAYLAGGSASIDSTLFLILAGANNFSAGPASIGAIVPDLVTRIGTLVGAGAQHIVLSNLADLTRTPFGLSLSSGDRATLEFTLDLVNGGIAGIWAALPGIVIPFDLFGTINGILDDPAAFGLTDTISTCIGLPTGCGGYVFFDDVHATTAVHAIAAREISLVAGLVPAPGLLALLLAGGLAFGFTRIGPRSSLGGNVSS